MFLKNTIRTHFSLLGATLPQKYAAISCVLLRTFTVLFKFGPDGASPCEANWQSLAQESEPRHATHVGLTELVWTVAQLALKMVTPAWPLITQKNKIMSFLHEMDDAMAFAQITTSQIVRNELSKGMPTAENNSQDLSHSVSAKGYKKWRATWTHMAFAKATLNMQWRV